MNQMSLRIVVKIALSRHGSCRLGTVRKGFDSLQIADACECGGTRHQLSVQEQGITVKRLMRTIWRTASLALLIGAGAVTEANSAIIYSTYSPGDPLLGGSYVYRSYDDEAGIWYGDRFAAAFQASQDYTLETATLSLLRVSGASSSFQLSLYSDEGNAPGGLLATFANPATIGSGSPGNYVFTTSIQVFGGQAYWLVASPSLGAQSFFIWNSVSGFAVESSSDLNGAGDQWEAWNTTVRPARLAYQLSGSSVVPEPGKLALFLVAGAVLLARWLRRS
jgi:hypothetical protein